ncbi:hypothetical protein [Bacillus subtilis]|uniref:hypothetical protein n=1 Tax=Bacillus subtilis TaxID=1423 RepID=UPI001430BD13|nr:hypothetical protein [Bacillus subtilis]MDL2030384.1 hypothetical protein [Bacillus subtilis]MDP0483769.1 hypothetical protein [Bacillus subtilis]NJI53649.1 hypothetical protein [Bacillus subtilis]
MEDTKMEQINKFNSVFKTFYNHFLEYLIASDNLMPEFKLFHNELFNDSKKLQYEFYLLPEELRHRLKDIGFYIFLQTDNPADFYEMKKFINNEESRKNKIFTLATRVDAEVDLAIHFIKNNQFEKYNGLLERDYKSYLKFFEEPGVEEPLKSEEEVDNLPAQEENGLWNDVGKEIKNEPSKSDKVQIGGEINLFSIIKLFIKKEFNR